MTNDTLTTSILNGYQKYLRSKSMRFSVLSVYFKENTMFQINTCSVPTISVPHSGFSTSLPATVYEHNIDFCRLRLCKQNVPPRHFLIFDHNLAKTLF